MKSAKMKPYPQYAQSFAKKNTSEDPFTTIGVAQKQKHHKEEQTQKKIIVFRTNNRDTNILDWFLPWPIIESSSKGKILILMVILM